MPQSYPDISRHLNLQKRGEDEKGERGKRIAVIISPLFLISLRGRQFSLLADCVLGLLAEKD